MVKNKDNIWPEISKNLKEIYRQTDNLGSFRKENEYLKEAFLFTENLWLKQFNRIRNLKVIMIAEAPLFGEKKTYIYNPETNSTAFFYYSDLNSFPTFKGEKAVSSNEKKEIMYKHFSKNGFLVLNIFPFALNPKDTSINFQKMKKSTYMDLLKITEKSYLLPKLEECFKKSKGRISFAYRYKRLYEKTEFHLDKVLKKNFKEKQYSIDSVHGLNMTLNREKLASLFNE